jgi:outer membrane protein OmpA-like peptidoglycan-associated protein
MADSLFTSLRGMLDSRCVGELAGRLGESEHSVSRGMQSSIAAVLGGLASKSEDASALRKILDLAPSASGNVSWSQMASNVSDPNSPLISGGKRLLSGLFGNTESNVVSALSADSGLRPGSTAALLTIAAPLVLNFISRRMLSEGISIGGLGDLLNREIPAIRSALPAGLSRQFWPLAPIVETPQVVAQTVEREKSSWGWIIGPLALAGILLGGFWLFTHTQKTVTAQLDSMATGTANRIAERPADLGTFVERTLPNNVTLNIPEKGVETRLVAFIEAPGAMPDKAAWFNFDRLVFDTGSATLRPESQEQVDNIAAILVAYPKVKLKIGGYTDNIGDRQTNLQLSRERANTVVAELVRRGISADRLTAEGYGEEYPVADNSVEAGRAENRRVAMRVTEK